MKRGSLFLAAFLVIGAALAQDLAELQARMIARRPAVVALLAAKNVGENNQGYLEEIKPLAAKEESRVVAEENADRRTVYAAIAQKTGVKVEVVGRSRAREIARIAVPGTMVQSEDGTWEERK